MTAMVVLTVTEAGGCRGLLAAPVRLGGGRGRAGQREDRHDHWKQHARGSCRSARQDPVHDW
jgi:hypothetical protein